jgi:hypothetical protein
VQQSCLRAEKSPNYQVKMPSSFSKITSATMQAKGANADPPTIHNGIAHGWLNNRFVMFLRRSMTTLNTVRGDKDQFGL